MKFLTENKMLNRIIYFFEQQAFGVCSWWAKKLGVRSYRVRLFFIYLSFVTLGVSFVLYLVMAFILDNKNLIVGQKKNSVWDI